MTDYEYPVLDEPMYSLPQPVARMPMIFFACTVAVALQALNFALTPNPYVGEHSGEKAIDGGLLLVIGIAISSLLRVRRFYPSILLFLPVLGSLISGAVTGSILLQWRAYSGICLGAIFVATCANDDAANRDRPIRFGYLLPLLLVIMIVGPLLAIFHPGPYGFLPFGFSRESRGEVTLWNLTGMHMILPAIAMTLMVARHKWRYVFLALALAQVVVHASTYTRVLVVISSLPIVLYMIHAPKKPAYRIVAIVLLFIVFLLTLQSLIHWVSGGKGFDVGLTKVTSGRSDLFMLYFNAFLKSPIFGIGEMPDLAWRTIYHGGAYSEVGIMRWFVTGGIIYGIPMTFLLLRAVYRGFRIIFSSNALPMDFCAAVVVLSSFPGMLIDQNNKIVSAVEILVYGCIFYLNYIRPSDNPQPTTDPALQWQAIDDGGLPVYAEHSW